MLQKMLIIWLLLFLVAMSHSVGRTEHRTLQNEVLGAQTTRHFRRIPEPPVAGSESIFSTILKLLDLT